MWRTALCCLVVVNILLLTSAQADIILDQFASGTPVDSWAYSKAVDVGRGNSIVYVPQVSHADGRSFLGYVTYPGSDGWLNLDNSYFLEDSIRLYRTYILSDIDQTLRIRVGGDDGHSVYVDDTFVDGDRFGIWSSVNVVLTAGLARKLEVLNYNGPGPSQLTVTRRETGLPIRTTPNLRINAVGDFASVPETAQVWFLSSVMSVAFMTRRVFGT